MKYIKLFFLYTINILLLLLMIVPAIISYLLSPIIAGFFMGYSVASNHIEMIQISITRLTQKPNEEENND